MGHRILVPFELPDAEPLSPVLVADLAPMEVVVLGHYGLPEQTPPDAARSQFLDEAEAEVQELARPLRNAGAAVTTRIVFGKARSKTIDRITREEDCDAELDPAPTESIERILVPLVDTANFDRLTDFVRALVEETTKDITLFHVAEAGEQADEVEAMLVTARDRMLAAGFDPGQVDISVIEAEEHDDEILRMAQDYDAVVMDEAHPDFTDWIFGTLPDRIAEETGDPVIVVRRDHRVSRHERKPVDWVGREVSK